MADFQFFKLTMECGHFYQVSAVGELAGAPYAPNYVGQTMPARCCLNSHKVASQESIPFVTGAPGEIG